MADIYSRSALTIAASASQDSRGGCFRCTPHLSGSSSWEIAVEYNTLNDDEGAESLPWRPEGVRWFDDDDMADYWEAWKSGGQILSTFNCSAENSPVMRYLPGYAPPASLPSDPFIGTANTINVNDTNRDKNTGTDTQSVHTHKPPNFLGKLKSLDHSTGVYVRELLCHQEFASNRTAMRPAERPLSSRAWVLQERLLSTRVLHYTASELVWECNSESYCQCGLVGCDAQWGSGSSPRVAKSLKLAFDHAIREARNGNPEPIKEMWNVLISMYTSRSMTHKTDRLPAASGLIKRLQQANVGECFAGMWRKYLPQHMMWYVLPGERSAYTRHETYVAPTWSWASVAAQVDFKENLVLPPATTGQAPLEPDRAAEILDVQYALAGIDPTGSLSDGVLTIRAPALTAELLSRQREQDAGSPAHSERRKFVFEIRHPQTGETVELNPDSRSDVDTLGRKQDVLCVQWTKQLDPQLVVARLRALGWRKKFLDLVSHVLVLRKSNKRLGKYERKGMVTLSTFHVGPDYRLSEQQSGNDKWFQGACAQTLDIV